MANVKIILNPINVTDYVVLVVAKVTAPSATVFSQVFNPPHAQRSFTVTDLDPVMYRFFFWESVDGVVLNTLLGSSDIDASQAGEAILEVLEFTTGGGGTHDPAANATEITHPSLIGADLLVPGLTPTGPVYQVHRRSVGPMTAAELSGDPVLGKITLQTPGDLLNDGEIIVVYKYYKQSISSGSAVLQSFYNGVVVKPEASFSLDSTYYNKKIILTGAVAVQTITVPDLSTIPAGRYFIFDTHSGSSGVFNYAAISFATYGIRFGGQLLSAFYMAQGEELCFGIRENGSGGYEAHILWYNGNAKARGRRIFDDTDRPGQIRAIGSKLSKANYPGLYAFVESLAPGVAVTFADWENNAVVLVKQSSPLIAVSGPFNRARWAINASTQEIYVPDLRGAMPKALALGTTSDGARTADVPGGWQVQNVGNHTHTKTRNKTQRGFGNGSNGDAVASPGGASFGGNFSDDSGNITGFQGANLVDNFGQIPYILL